ncbi:MAG: glycosyl hydrolase family 43, partial [Muribaculaceae bacterium]|nr:glycosyl hydrolase family 43 [Muribaculaceae bacterium]
MKSLREGFNNPPQEAQVCTWWHWLDGNVTREGITADLEAMHRVGIHEATLFNGGMGFPQGPVKYMSDEWLELFKHAASEAKRLGMELSFHNGPGWSSSGGPWVKPEDAMQTVTWSEQQVEGGRTVCLVMPQPKTNHGCYQDIAVLAFPTPMMTQRIGNLDVKTLANNAFQRHLMPSLREVPDSVVVHQADIVDLTDQMQPGGTLAWEAPEGRWTILRFGFTPTGMTNHPALAGGNGLECDKMSRKALDAFWAGGIQPIIDRLGPLVGTGLTGSLIDSYEVGCGNWTPGFETEFKARRHYDLKLFLPAMAGYYVESGPVAERFLWDLRLTVGELMAENYYDYFAELCKKHGMRFLTEPYEGPFNALEVGREADVPMSEFWVGNNEFSGMANLAASIAHANGRQVVGAESFTATGMESRHRNHPGMLKAQGDYNWSNGVNRFILHTNAHQPWEVGPGFSLGQYG